MKKQVRNIAIVGTAAAIVIFGFVLPKTNAQNNEAMYRSYVEEKKDENGNPIEEVNVMKLENEKSKKDKVKSKKDEAESRKGEEKSLKEEKESQNDEAGNLKDKGENKEKTVSKKKVSLKKEAIEPIMFSRAMHFKDYDKELKLVEDDSENAEEVPEGLEVAKTSDNTETPTSLEEVSVKK